MGQEITWRMRTLWNIIKAMSRRKVLPKSDLNYKPKLVLNDDWWKKVLIFLDLSVRENLYKTRLTPISTSDPLWFASLCWWPLSSPFSGALRISFSRCFSLDIRLFTYAFSYSLSRSSRRILPFSASFLTFQRVFLDSLYPFNLLLSLVALSLSFQPIFTQNPFFTNWNYNNFLRLTKR